ncbi:hypothetical protein, partial [Stenotrophomonas sepilia]|uniref:hypothetical protein n=1 Tax=Stenotrophomonas sepilia TaxID=2860290 RepID=UPI002E799338
PPTRSALSNPAFCDHPDTTHEGLRRWPETSWRCAMPVVEAFSQQCDATRSPTKVREKRYLVHIFTQR